MTNIAIAIVVKTITLGGAKMRTFWVHQYFFRRLYLYALLIVLVIQVGPKKSLLIDLEEKCLRNSKLFFDRVFLSIY